MAYDGEQLIPLDNLYTTNSKTRRSLSHLSLKSQIEHSGSKSNSHLTRTRRHSNHESKFSPNSLSESPEEVVKSPNQSTIGKSNFGRYTLESHVTCDERTMNAKDAQVNLGGKLNIPREKMDNLKLSSKICVKPLTWEMKKSLGFPDSSNYSHSVENSNKAFNVKPVYKRTQNLELSVLPMQCDDGQGSSLFRGSEQVKGKFNLYPHYH